MKVLIIEDEPELANSMANYLQKENYVCDIVDTLKDAIDKINVFEYDSILLDLMLPDGDGTTILKFLSEQGKSDGVIIISAKSGVEDKIVSLKKGADDYLIKPFHLAELAARMYSLIRRKSFDHSNILVLNELKINFLSKTVSVNDHIVELTKKEFELLVYFISNRDRVLSKSILAEHLSGDMAEMLGNHNFVYAHIKNLKHKLYEAGCQNYIKTIYATGYKWEND